jgi:hypothetical protein
VSIVTMQSRRKYWLALVSYCARLTNVVHTVLGTVLRLAIGTVATRYTDQWLRAVLASIFGLLRL